MIKLHRLIKRMVKEQSDSQFVRLLTRELDDLFVNLLNPEMQFLKSHLYQLYYIEKTAYSLSNVV